MRNAVWLDFIIYLIYNFWTPKAGPYKRPQNAALRQAKFYLLRQALAAIVHLLWVTQMIVKFLSENSSRNSNYRLSLSLLFVCILSSPTHRTWTFLLDWNFLEQLWRQRFLESWILSNMLDWTKMSKKN